jgi:hypothetical protein
MDLIDINRQDIAQPESSDRYPSDLSVDIIRDLVAWGGEIRGYEDNTPAWNPVVEVSRDKVTYVEKILGRIEEWNSPGLICWLVEDDWIWGTVAIEDWYEMCIDYQGQHLAKGDPTVWDIIESRNETIREEIQSKTDHHVTVRHGMHDTTNALYGQWRWVSVDARVWNSYSTNRERGNPDW